MPAIDFDLLQRALVSRIEVLEKEAFELRVPAEGIASLVLVAEDGENFPTTPLAERLKQAHSRLIVLLAKARQS